MDLLGSVERVVKVAIKINELVETVQQNKKDCKKVARVVEIRRSMVEHLAKTAVASDQTMIDAINDLEETFLHALKLVKACQTKNIIWLFIMAGNVSKQLREMKDEIMDHMHIANFGNGIQQTVMFSKGDTQDLAAKPKKLLKVRTVKGEQEIHAVGDRHVWQDTDIYDIAEEVVDTDASYSADAARSEIHGEKDKFPAGGLEETISRFRNFSLSELKRLTNNFSDQNKIGTGGFATVYKGVLRNGAEVAIKEFSSLHGFEDNPYVVRYAELFSVIGEHKNVIRFFGYCHETKIEVRLVKGKCRAVYHIHMLVVEEYMPKGNLSEIIDELDWPSAFRIIREIAQCVAHIHMRGAVHLDLKPANILLDYEMNPKICDFELSKILNEDDEIITESAIGTIIYMPPEYIADSIVSSKNDVYAFGVLLLQTISKSGLLQDSTDWIWNALGGEGVDGLLGTLSRDESDLKEVRRCVHIGLQCAARERTDRPTMRDVVEMLEGKEEPRKTPPIGNKASSFKRKGRALSRKL